jgi:hypothetical protein
VAELVVVTCQDGAGAAYCDADQMGASEWHAPGGAAGPPDDDPLHVTIAVCWRSSNRTVGECTWNGAQLATNDANADGVITGPGLMFASLTCL